MNLSATTKKIFKEHPLKIVLALFCIILFIAIKVWEWYTPLPIHDWNRKEISLIKVGNPSDFTFAVFGDNKGNNSIFEPLLRDIDHNMKIAFAIDLGDLVDGGKKGAFSAFLKQAQENLAIPLLTAIGNHDLNNGSDNYREIFGPTYYAFQLGQSHFIFLDATTESGFDQAERQWLEVELQKAQTSKTRFVFMHVSPFDPRGSGFNKCLQEKDGKDLLDLFRRYKVTHLFASHIHGYFSGVWEDVPYTITGGAGAGLQGSAPEHFFHHYVQVNVHNGKINMIIRRIGGQGAMARFFNLMKNYVLEWGLLLGAGISVLSLGLSLTSRHGSSSDHLKRD